MQSHSSLQERVSVHYKEVYVARREDLEIERKFWVVRPRTVASIPQAMAEFQTRLVPLLAQERSASLHIFDGHDVYFAQPNDPTLFVRIRQNMLRKEMTTKRTSDDGGLELREEENLQVISSEQRQKHFLSMLGFKQRFTVRQSGNIYVIPGKVEVVIYWVERLPERTDACVFVEIEALGGNTVDEAVALLDHFEHELGFTKSDRCQQSIFQLFGGSAHD